MKCWSPIAALLLLVFWPPAEAVAKDPRKAVAKFDENGDGRIAPKEWPKGKASFQKIDKDGDGFLTPGDFAEHWGMARGKEARAKKGGGAIPLIDAHSQVDCNVSENQVIGQLDKLKISRALISIRGCKGWKSEDIEARSLDWARKHPDRLSVHLSTKVDGWSFNDLKSGAIAAFESRARRDGFVGMGEVLVQHAAHSHAKLSYPELAIGLDDRRVGAAIALARSRGWPVILHIELDDNERAAEKTLADLKALLAKHPDTAFVLIHMGQASPDEARALIESHGNIHFLTTAADDFTAFATRKARQKGSVAQSGWVNLFQGGCEVQSCPKAWKPAWKKLLTDHPDRFVLGFENVFANHWGKPFEIKVGIWRRALKMLPPEVAHALAHRNAERLWSLPPAR